MLHGVIGDWDSNEPKLKVYHIPPVCVVHDERYGMYVLYDATKKSRKCRKMRQIFNRLLYLKYDGIRHE